MSTGVLPIRRRARLLVVDDVIAIHRIVERGLGDVFNLTFAEDGMQALELIRTSARFDVILTDIAMPNLDGLDLHEQLRALYPELAQRTVFMSGTAGDPRVREALDELNLRVFSKPFAVTQLKAHLVDLLDRLGLNEPERPASADSIS